MAIRGPVRKRTIEHVSVLAARLSRSCADAFLKSHLLAKVQQNSKRELILRAPNGRFRPCDSRLEVFSKTSVIENGRLNALAIYLLNTPALKALYGPQCLRVASAKQKTMPSTGFQIP